MDREPTYVNLTADTLDGAPLCCIHRKGPHPGLDGKRRWLAERLGEGHVFRRLNSPGATAFIEYAPLETAWVPVLGDGYLYIYCLWVAGAEKGRGHGRALMEYCLQDARQRGCSGVCMLGSVRQKNWLSSQSFAKKYGLAAVDTAPDGYELLALSFDGTRPRFTAGAKTGEIAGNELTVYYDAQCPFIPQKVESCRAACAAAGITARFIEVDTLEKAKALPCVFNNWAVFAGGKLATVNLLDGPALLKLAGK